MITNFQQTPSTLDALSTVESISSKSSAELLEIVNAAKSEKAMLINQLGAFVIQLSQLTTVNCSLVKEKDMLIAQLDSYRRLVEEHEYEMRKLKSEVDELRMQVENLKIEIQKSNLAVSEIKQHLGARELASYCEKRAMEFVFPNGRKTPFHLRSLKNIYCFLGNPTVSNFCGEGGPEEWEKFDELKQIGIRQRAIYLQQSYPDLVISIDDLKELGNEIAHRSSSVEELKDYFRDNEEIIAALNICEIYRAE